MQKIMPLIIRRKYSIRPPEFWLETKIVETNSPIFFNSDDGYVNFIEGGENDSNEEFTDYEKQFRIKDNIVVLNYNNRNIFPDGQSSLNKNNGYFPTNYGESYRHKIPNLFALSSNLVGHEN